MKTVEIVGELRTNLGKSSSKVARREGKVLCNLYGAGQNYYFQADDLAFRDIIYTPECRKASIQLEGKNYEAMVKEVQFHPVTDKILHIDFVQLIPGKKVVAEIPLRFIGSSVGVKAGGTLIQKVRKVKVLAQPESLVAALDVDLTELDLGKSLRIRDIKVGEGMEIINSPSIPVATIDIPRALRSAQTTAAKDGKKK